MTSIMGESESMGVSTSFPFVQGASKETYFFLAPTRKQRILNNAGQRMAGRIAARALGGHQRTWILLLHRFCQEDHPRAFADVSPADLSSWSTAPSMLCVPHAHLPFTLQLSSYMLPQCCKRDLLQKKNSKIYTERQKTLKATLRKNKIRDLILPDFDL